VAAIYGTRNNDMAAASVFTWMDGIPVIVSGIKGVIDWHCWPGNFEKINLKPARMSKWYWKSDLRLKNDDDLAWTEYAEEDSERIEKAYKKNQKTMKFSDKYKINFVDMIQHKHVRTYSLRQD